ncbi:MAG: alpha-galactosidase [Thermoguttaceae bacterium]|jgi:hypothetical protein|nr:alpha-galactosidase [Thermoguttaceae bacterium]
MNPLARTRRLRVALALLAGLGGQSIASPRVQAVAIVREDGAQPGMELLDGQAAPWLNRAACGVQLGDGTSIRSDGPRYRAAIKTQDNQAIVQFFDTQRQLDQTWTITALDDRCFTFLLTVTNTGDVPLTLSQITVLEGVFVEKHDPGKPHILLNGDSTSRPLPTILAPGVESLTCLETVALESPAVAAGFLTGKHNLNRFAVLNPSEQPALRAFGDCNGCLLMSGASRQTDMLFVSLHDNPLEQLERYADLAGEINGARIWPPRVAWCTWYAGWMHVKMASYKNGLEKGVEENIPYVKKYFANRGGNHTMRICDDYQLHGDWGNKSRTIPGGFDRLASMISDAGIVPGVWYAPYWASTDSEAFKKHPEWFALDKDGSVYIRIPWGTPDKPQAVQQPVLAPGEKAVTTSPEVSESPRTLMALYGAPALAIFDTSRPDVQQYFEDAARRWRERGFRYVSTDYLGAAMNVPRYQDPTMTKVEVLRAGLEAIRRGLGKDVFYRKIGGGPIGVGMGLADDLRISGDSHGDNPAAYFRTAQVWFYHRRLWLNDPSAVVCARYGELRPIEWNRMWTSWIAMSGTVMTYGDVLDELPEPYITMYQRLFPPLPAAGRPLDLWENDPYMLWGMDPGEADGPYTLFGVFDVTGEAAGRVSLNLDEIAARARGWQKPTTAPAEYVLWDFWNQKLLCSRAERLQLETAPRSGRILALRARLGRPQLLGTQGHFSQGVVETEGVAWNAAENILAGKVRGNGGDPTILYFLVPDSMRLAEASLGAARAQLAVKEAGVLALQVPETGELMDFALRFEGTAPDPEERPFVAGRAATRVE